MSITARAAELKVSDVMTAKVVTVSVDAVIGDVGWGLTTKGVSGAPVCDGSGRVLGVISKSDLMNPDKLNPSHRVRDIMTHVVYTVGPDDPAEAAVRKMVEHSCHRLIVVDENSALVGIVTPVDILCGIYAIERPPPPSEQRYFNA